jgi:hypothetical protein
MKMTRWTGRRLIYAAAILGFAAGSLAIASPAKRLLALAAQDPICIGPTQSDDSEEAAFLDGNATAMTKMMTDMTIKPAGDVDRDFAAMMIPHHQGAVDMAKLQLIYGHDPVLRRLAQAIIVEQRQEIDLMQTSLDKRSELRP